ncbi:hypothetical protein fHeYen902_161 [Yersinia phage fHe-Yen9-02]|nr:hypothetical protein fHeYen902_161 [Yersinia phage fHe-Yen9-02]
MKYPRPNNQYTLLEILTELDLKDTPCLSFKHSDARGEFEPAIQDSHVTEEQLLSIEGLADTHWKYIRTTDEWIPVFVWAKDNERPITDFIDIAEEIDPYESKDKNGFWCTPKGFPREQYYYRDAHGDYRRTHDKKLHNEY